MLDFAEPGDFVEGAFDFCDVVLFALLDAAGCLVDAVFDFGQVVRRVFVDVVVPPVFEDAASAGFVALGAGFLGDSWHNAEGVMPRTMVQTDKSERGGAGIFRSRLLACAAIRSSLLACAAILEILRCRQAAGGPSFSSGPNLFCACAVRMLFSASQHDFTNDGDWWASCCEEAIMEVFECVGIALRFLVVIAQRQDLHLS